MRGNEITNLRETFPSIKRFPIPMRGNEVTGSLPAVAGHRVGEFPIPMRGNELASRERIAALTDAGFRSP